MATLDYVEVPSYATRLRSTDSHHDLRPAPKVVTTLPRPEHSPVRSASPMPMTQPMSPTKTGSNLTSMLLTSALQLPTNAPSTPHTYGAKKGAPRLLSTRDPLSIPITTTNFRKFVAKSGPVFWLQDRIEEIILWKRGWKYTVVWMAAYAFLCEANVVPLQCCCGLHDMSFCRLLPAASVLNTPCCHPWCSPRHTSGNT